MKREEILAVLTDHAKLWEGRGDIGYAGDLIAIRGVIASALADAERYRWLRERLGGPLCVRKETSQTYGRHLVFEGVFGEHLDTAIDTARAAAAGGEELT